MLKGNTADVSGFVKVKQSVLIKISRFDDMPGIELDVQGIGVFEVFEFHGLNLRSKNAL